MPRPTLPRFIANSISPRAFEPAGIRADEPGELALSDEEVEALRLADLEGLYHEAAARSMGVSRQTFGRVLESARRVVADALVNGKVLKIGGGDAAVRAERERRMVIAVPARDGFVDEHFGHCKEFLVFDVGAEGAVAPSATIRSPEGCGCKSGVAAELARAGVTHLVAGNMGEGAVRVLGSHGIAVVRGASGDALAAARAFAAGELADSGRGCAEHRGAGGGAGCGH